MLDIIFIWILIRKGRKKNILEESLNGSLELKFKIDFECVWISKWKLKKKKYFFESITQLVQITCAIWIISLVLNLSSSFCFELNLEIKL